MDARIERLLSDLARVGHPAPADLSSFLAELPEVGTLPTPWETWTLIGLVRHRRRQYWVRDIIRDRLGGDCADLGAMGSMGHPGDVPQLGSVPGLPEWEYYFHGRGCCLTHKVTGESIDVDFWDDTAEFFDPYFYAKYLQSLRNPEGPEGRLRELHRKTDVVRLAMDRLSETGAVTRPQINYATPWRLAEDMLARQDIIDRFCEAWSDPTDRVWIAGLIGDWPAAHEAVASRPDLRPITGPRAERCRAIRRDWLIQKTGRDAAEALIGLAELGEADRWIEAAFRGPPSAVVAAALDIVGERPDPKWLPSAYATFRRAKPDGPPPEPHLWIRTLAVLLRNGYRSRELAARLPDAGGTTIGDAAMLALEHAPEHALPLIRRALLDRIPCNRSAAAAILANFAEPWSIRELLNGLAASKDQERTAYVRAALLETGDPAAERAVREWEELNPHEDEPGHYLDVDGRTVGPLYSMAENMLKGSQSFLRFEMEQLHDRVAKVRRTIPPEPTSPKPWWRIWEK